jgi:hypothetical protein
VSYDKIWKKEWVDWRKLPKEKQTLGQFQVSISMGQNVAVDNLFVFDTQDEAEQFFAEGYRPHEYVGAAPSTVSLIICGYVVKTKMTEYPNAT